MSEDLKEYWRKAHIEKNSNLLTGTSGESTLANLQITSRIESGITVLEIGVGDGRSIREMVERGVKMSAVDIVPEAFECIKDLPVKVYLEDQLGTLPDLYFDLAISHQVACHQSNDTLREQIRNVVRSLVPTGLFAILVARMSFYPLNISWDYTNDIENIKAGARTRDYEEMVQLIKEAGGRSVHISSSLRDDSWIYNYVVHIMKAKHDET